MSSATGAAVGALVEERVFNNGKIDFSMINVMATAAAYDLMLNLPRMYWGYAINIASEAGSIASELMEFDPEFGKCMEIFFNAMVDVLGGAI